jgi:phosphohistidine phosphatase
MLRLSLLRHAKSSWDAPDFTDHERQLTKRGTKAARRIGQYISENNLIPDLTLCSDATRTRDTLSLMINEWPQPHPRAIITAELYLAAPGTILNAVMHSSKGVKHVMVIGHNPGLHDLACSLPSKARIKSDLDRLALKYPTGALAHLTFKLDNWSEIDTASGLLDRFVVPRELPD